MLELCKIYIFWNALLLFGSHITIKILVRHLNILSASRLNFLLATFCSLCVTFCLLLVTFFLVAR